MSHSKLLLPDQEPKKHGSDTSAQSLLRKHNGLGNQDLLATLGSPKAMPESVKASMEKSLGSDFSDVRLYESSLVDQAGAQAAASGNHVAFAPGKMDFHSQAGLELLGHELSHVASQRRGEVSGSGLVHNASLEHKADADGLRAMSAFDADLGSDLTPINAGPAPASPAGPIQARKKKKSAAESFTEGFNDLDLAQQVSVARDRALSGSVPYDEFDQSVYDAYRERLKTVTPEFMEEILRQQVAGAQGLVADKQDRIYQGETEDEATYKTKYSHQATLYQAYSTLLADIANENGDKDPRMQHYFQQYRNLREEHPELLQTMKTATQDIVSGKETWKENPENAEEAERIPGYMEDMAKTYLRNLKIPQKRSRWQRLFHRR